MKGVDDRILPWTGTRGGQACRPFPRPYDGNGTPPSATETAVAFVAEAGDPLQLAALTTSVSNGAWEAMRTAFAHTDIHIPATRITPGSLANRVVFRYAAPQLSISALDLLAETKPVLRDHIVFIGQTFAENRDMHVTPLGVMPGAVVLMNAVDSMVRHRVVEKPHPALVWSLTAVLLVLVAGFNAKFSVNVAGALCTAVLICALLPLSYWLFKYGVWLDFALPLLAVLGHALYELIKHSGGHQHDVGSANHHNA
jgi:CHASE2 domain-containing sensor protein